MTTRTNVQVVWRGLLVRVDGVYTPPEAPSGPSYASGGDPGSDAEFEPEHVWLIPDQKGVDFIDLDGHVEACDAWGEIREVAEEDVADAVRSRFEYEAEARWEADNDR
jgi:hypothetical protein